MSRHDLGPRRLVVLAVLVALFVAGSHDARADATTATRAYARGDYATALKEAGPLAQQGNANAQYVLAHLYYYGRAVRRKIDVAESMFRRAAEQGLAAAQFDLGKFLLAKPGDTERNRKEARIWIVRAAEQGLAKAYYMTAAVYAQGIGGDADMEIATRWYKESAKNGDGRAHYFLGLVARAGEGKTIRDLAAAERHFNRAADAGVLEANHALGLLQLSARGIRRSTVNAIGFFVIAANDGFAPSQRVLGQMYKDGIGVKKDDERAYLWLLKAANGGDAIARFELGAVFEAGLLGQPRDLPRALAWFDVAGALGHDQAAKDRDRLIPSMTDEDIAEGKKLAAGFRGEGAAKK